MKSVPLPSLPPAPDAPRRARPTRLTRSCCCCACAQLVGKDVWEALLSESAEVTGIGDAEDPSPPNANLGGHKRPRAAVSLSSVGARTRPVEPLFPA